MMKDSNSMHETIQLGHVKVSSLFLKKTETKISLDMPCYVYFSDKVKVLLIGFQQGTKRLQKQHKASERKTTRTTFEEANDANKLLGGNGFKILQCYMFC